MGDFLFHFRLKAKTSEVRIKTSKFHLSKSTVFSEASLLFVKCNTLYDTSLKFQNLRSSWRLSGSYAALWTEKLMDWLQGEGTSCGTRWELKLSGLLPGQLHPTGSLAAAAMRRLTGATDAWIRLHTGKRGAQMANGEESDARAQVRLLARHQPRQKTNVLSGSVLG